MKKLILLSALVATQSMATDLAEVLQQASEKDPVLRSAKSNALAGDENIRIARANFLPQVSGTWNKNEGDGTLVSGGTSIEVPDTDSQDWRITLNQTIYDQANYETMKQARLQAALGNARYDVAYQDFLIRVAERYFAVLTNNDSVRFAEAEEKAIQRQLDQAEQRYEVGLAAITDVHEARAQYDASRAAVIQARNTLDDAKEALYEVSQAYYRDMDALPDDLKPITLRFTDLEKWQDVAFENNPDLGVSRINADLAKITMKLQRAGHYPSVSFSANRRGNDDFSNPRRNPATLEIIDVFESNSNGTSYGITVDVPIFAGGRTYYQTKKARLEYEAALEDLDQSSLSTTRNIRNAIRNVDAGWSSVQARQLAVVSAKSAEEATEAGFEVGTRNIVEVLNSQRSLYQAQRDFSQAKYDYLLNVLRLDRAAGTLTDENLLNINKLLVENDTQAASE
ncbi:TolC family outer membrane protein [Marinicella sp. W31]|uniref:TolC family outer membrane protein n=1 Tax=Marinicella sp. W31 TaxID=3023713 RepID=UPI003756B504